MRKLKTNEVMKLDSFAIVPAFTDLAKSAKITWPHAAVYLTRMGSSYLVQWGEGQSQLIEMREDTHAYRYRFVCPACSVAFRNFYFDGNKWGCFRCLGIEQVDTRKPKLTIAEAEEAANAGTLDDLIKGLITLLGEEQ